MSIAFHVHSAEVNIILCTSYIKSGAAFLRTASWVASQSLPSFEDSFDFLKLKVASIYTCTCLCTVIFGWTDEKRLPGRRFALGSEPKARPLSRHVETLQEGKTYDCNLFSRGGYCPPPPPPGEPLMVVSCFWHLGRVTPEFGKRRLSCRTSANGTLASWVARLDFFLTSPLLFVRFFFPCPCLPPIIVTDPGLAGLLFSFFPPPAPLLPLPTKPSSLNYGSGYSPLLEGPVSSSFRPTLALSSPLVRSQWQVGIRPPQQGLPPPGQPARGQGKPVSSPPPPKNRSSLGRTSQFEQPVASGGDILSAGSFEGGRWEAP